MNINRSNRIIIAALTILICIVSFVIPAGAVEYPEGTIAALALSLVWDDSIAPPMLSGETALDLYQVNFWIGFENAYQDPDASSPSYGDGVFEAMRYGNNSIFNQPVTLESVSVYAFNASAERWVDISYRYINTAYNYYSASGQLGLDGSFYMGSDLKYTGTYRDFFGMPFQNGIEIELVKQPRYAFYYENPCFAVRWTSTNSVGDVEKFCYIGIISEGSFSSKSLIMHANKHPYAIAQVYGSASGGDEALQDRIDELEAENGTLQSTVSILENEVLDLTGEVSSLSDAYIQAEKTIQQRDQTITGLRRENQLIAAERDNAYDQGFADGNASAGLGLDTSSPEKTVLSFFAVLFKGVRDFIFPFLEVEISGVSILTLVGVIGLIVFVAIVIGIVAKVRGG